MQLITIQICNNREIILSSISAKNRPDKLSDVKRKWIEMKMKVRCLHCTQVDKDKVLIVLLTVDQKSLTRSVTYLFLKSASGKKIQAVACTGIAQDHFVHLIITSFKVLTLKEN